MDLSEQINILGDLNQPIQNRSLRALSDLDETGTRVFRDVWPTIPGERRYDIVHAMVAVAEDNIDLDFRQALLVCLDDPDAAVRVAAVDGLWEDERTQTMHLLLGLLDDSSGDVRAAATVGLSRFAYRAELGELAHDDALAVVRALLDAAADPEQPFEVRRRAIEGLGYFSSSAEAQAAIGRAYAHPEQLMRESAVVAMGRSMRPTWFPYIERELRSPSPALRYEAARAVGELGEDGRNLIQPLLPLVEDDDVEVSLAAIWALGQVGGPHARRVLQRLARSKDEARSEAASEALEELDIDDL